MSSKPFVIAALAAALGACASQAASSPQNLAVAPAPVTFDGHV